MTVVRKQRCWRKIHRQLRAHELFTPLQWRTAQVNICHASWDMDIGCFGVCQGLNVGSSRTCTIWQCPGDSSIPWRDYIGALFWGCWWALLTMDWEHHSCPTSRTRLCLMVSHGCALTIIAVVLRLLSSIHPVPNNSPPYALSTCYNSQHANTQITISRQIIRMIIV